MTQDDVVGRPIEDAVDKIVASDVAGAAGTPDDPETVRETLARVAEDGVVTEAAIEDAIAQVSTVVSTPETRVELAEQALSDARERADAVDDLDAVRFRLESHEARLDALADDLGVLREDLAAVTPDREDVGSTYALAERIRRLTRDAERTRRRADALQEDVEEFERWLGDHDRRIGSLVEDANALEETVDRVEDALDLLSDAGAGDAGDQAGGTDDEAAEAGEPASGTDAEASGADDRAADVDDPAAGWYDAALHHRVYDLLLDDIRAERDDVEEWVMREGIHDRGRAAALRQRLDRLADRLDGVGDRIETIERGEWTDAYGERLAEFEAELDEYDPPVRWDAVQATFDDYRPVDAGSGEEGPAAADER